MSDFLEYTVKPGSNVPQGLPEQHLAVLSPIWRAPSLTLEYPDGEIHVLMGWSGSAPGEPCDLQIFWTRSDPGGPPVALAIGGDAGVRQYGPGATEVDACGFPFLALATIMIPAAVRDVIGPPPPPEPPPVLLLS
jgi:hypothetical protein